MTTHQKTNSIQMIARIAAILTLLIVELSATRKTEGQDKTDC